MSGATGSMILDIVLVFVCLGAAISGYRQGGFSATLSFVGVALGGYLGLKLIPVAVHFAEDKVPDSASARFFAALLTVTVVVVICYAIGSGIGAKLRDNIRTREALRADSVVGSIVQVFTTLLIVWLILVLIATGNVGGFGKTIKGSKILSAVGNAAPVWFKQLPAQTSQLINDSGFPMIADPMENLPTAEVDPPDNALMRSPAVQNTRDSVLRVVGQAEQCSRMLQGTGWVVAEDTVMTNAHVVAGTNEVTLMTKDGPREARVVYYNPQVDIALLRSENLPFVPMKWAEGEGQQGQDAIVMGYPNGGPFKATPARIREKFVVSGPNIYADERVEREAYSLRGAVVQGNSGGPLIDKDGHVLGVVFGADINEEDTGYALTREEVMKHVGDVTSHQGSPATGACVAE
ncbi:MULTISPECIES: MarP family serine protease [unclassified Corynebacterium]|uniref:MarP family serine protease n=1 Tax=unclassified Corynebacterium TaxID=2624378 RepID=UPI001EF5D726|nr:MULTISPECIES: MarP family serine protease [unclassified Corynebacterium]MCG7258302.1 MarP family serine protease [Corynebacterium sp. ACRQK]MCG7262847.1 MarP family serine protease [Corynebacterium sp. ACRQL]